MLKEIAVCLVLCPFLVNGEITEIMYNPSGGDNNREYVELIFNEEILMDGWTVKDSSHEDIILLVNGTGNSKINLIVEEGYSGGYFEGIDLQIVSVYSAGKAIGNGLSNMQDTVSLYDLQMELIDEKSYDGSIANGDGNAVCFDGEEEYSCTPSPGDINGESNNETENIGENETVEEVLTFNDEEGYIRIEGVDSNSKNICGNIKVRVDVWNDRDETEIIKAYLMDINVVSSFRIKAHEGQVIEFPVAICNNTIYPQEGEYVLVVEGLREKDMRLVWINGQEVFEKEGRTLLQVGAIERDINAAKEVNLDTKIAPKGRKWWEGMIFYLLYIIGGMGIYFVLFRM